MIALVNVELKKLFREPLNLAMNLIMPVSLTLVFWLAFGKMYAKSTPDISQFGKMVPGTVGYAIIFLIVTISLAFSEYKESGLLKRISTTPVTPTEYLGSHIISNMLISLFQAVVVVILSYILGFRPQGGLIGMILAFVFIGLLCLTSVGLGLICASIAKNPSSANGISFFFVFPQMVFGTGLIYTAATRPISMITPNSYVFEGLTLIFNGTPLSEFQIWQDLGILAIISLVVIAVGIQVFKKFGYK